MGGSKIVYTLRILLLARLLVPDDFGLIAIATTAMGFLFNITNLGMAPALVQGNELKEEHYHAAWTLDFIRSLFLVVITIAAAPIIAAIFAEPRAVPIIQVLALRPLLESMVSIKVVALNRNLTFRPLAVLRLVEAVANTLISVFTAPLLGAWALVAGALGGALAVLVTSYILAPYRPRLILAWEIIRPLIHFGRWIFATNLISLISNNLLRILISRQFGAAGLGVFYMATQLAFLPGDIAGEAVGAVAFPLFARLQENIQQATRVFRAMLSGLSAALYPVCALIIVLAPALTADILGPNWAGTENLIRILALVVGFGIFGEVTVSVFKGFGQPYRITLVELVQSTLMITLAWLLSQRFGLLGAALAWVPAILISQLMSAHYIQLTLDHPFRGLQRPFLAILAATTLCVAISAGISRLLPGVIGFGAAVGSGLLITAVFLWAADSRFQLGFARDLVSVFPQIAFLVNPSTVEKP
jgi:PST family polysaccharide transporter